MSEYLTSEEARKWKAHTCRTCSGVMGMEVPDKQAQKRCDEVRWCRCYDALSDDPWHMC